MSRTIDEVAGAAPSWMPHISRLRDPQRICDHLVDTALRDGGTDDITVLTVEVVDTGTA
jgi:serine/threonine protein phosphatase PrpC